ncbi:MAG: biotin/lipoyl-containing protein [Candidatus Thorarchaeota archaeon]
MSQDYDLDLDGKVYRVSVQRLDEGGLLVIRVGDQSFTLKPTPNDDGTWTVNDTATDHSLKIVDRSGSNVTVEINGTKREVKWSRVRKESSVAPVRSSTGPTKRVEGGVYPPMPGKIAEVRVRIGDSVSAGDTVCVLEAMKMFNELKAPRDGTVREVNIEPGSSVTPNDLLVLIE